MESRKGGVMPVTINGFYFFVALAVMFWVGYWRGKAAR
jgi:hypothetical protein